MAGRRNGRAYDYVVVDLNTQHDYCDPDGTDRVANVQELIPALRHVVAWAKRNCTPVISSIESHRPFELSDSGHPVCCVDGSAGQRKVEFTLFRHCAWVEVDNTLSIPSDLFTKYQQVIFRKRTDDLLGNPKADRLLNQLRAKEFVLFGIGVEGPIKALALSLLARRRRVTIVVDACGYWNRATAELALLQMTAKGARLVTVSDLLRRKLKRRWRYNSRERLRPVDDPNTRGRNGLKNGPVKRHRLDRGLPPTSLKTKTPKSGGQAPGDGVQDELRGSK